jgi:hypothetical protein
VGNQRDVNVIRFEKTDEFFGSPCDTLLTFEALITGFTLKWRTSEIKPSGISSEGSPVFGKIAGQYSTGNLHVNRNDDVILISGRRNSYPTFIPGTDGKSGPVNISDFDLEHVQPG